MGQISTWLATALVGHVTGAAYTPAETVYLGVSTADPLPDGSGLAEPMGNGYARAAIVFGAASLRRVVQGAGVALPEATGAWGTVTHWAVFDAFTGGHLLAFGDLGIAKTVVAGNTLSAPAGAIYVVFEPGGISTDVAHKLLDLALRNVAYAAPATYVGVATATLSDSTTGATVTEPSGGGYARVLVNAPGGAAPAWASAADGETSNGAVVEFALATGTWGTVYAGFVASAASGGDVLFYDNGLTDQAVTLDDVVQFAAGAIVLAID